MADRRRILTALTASRHLFTVFMRLFLPQYEKKRRNIGCTGADYSRPSTLDCYRENEAVDSLHQRRQNGYALGRQIFWRRRLGRCSFAREDATDRKRPIGVANRITRNVPANFYDLSFPPLFPFSFVIVIKINFTPLKFSFGYFSYFQRFSCLT